MAKKTIKKAEKPEVKPKAKPKSASPFEKIEVTQEELMELQKKGLLVGWDGKFALVKKEVA